MPVFRSYSCFNIAALRPLGMLEQNSSVETFYHAGGQEHTIKVSAGDAMSAEEQLIGGGIKSQTNKGAVI